MAIYLVLEREVPEFDVGEMDGKSLARALPEKRGQLLSDLENFISVTEEQRAEFLTDLRAMQRGLQLAVEQGARFHLALDY